MVRQGLLALGRTAAAAARLLWPRASPWPRLTAGFWVLAGAASLASALVNTIRSPSWQYDMIEVLSWFAPWTRGGASPYSAAGLVVDYPPHAFISLSWLGVLPAATTLAWYPWVNGAIAILTCWQIATWFPEFIGEDLRGRERLALAGMVAATRAIRRAIVSGQTVLFAVLLFAMALRLSRRRPVIAGLCFAVAAYKLNMAAGFGLALLLLGHWTVLAVAAAGVAAMTAVFAMSVKLPVSVLLGQWLADFTLVYGGRHFLPGVTGLRTILADWLPYGTVTRLYPLAAAVTLALLWRYARDAPSSPTRNGLVLCGSVLWAMFSLTHQRYNAVLLLLGLWIMHWPRHPLISDGVTRWLLPTALLGILVAAVPDQLIAWLPTLAALAPPDLRAWSGAGADLIWRHGLRVVVAVSLVLVLRALRRMGRPPETSVARP